MFRNANPLILSFMSSPSTSASVNYNDKRKSNDWRCGTHNTDFMSPDENEFDYKKNRPGRKKFSEILKSEICTKWDNKEISRTTNK